MARILYVQHNPEVSGSTLSLLYLLEQLDPARYEATVLFHTGDGPGAELFRRHSGKGDYGRGQRSFSSTVSRVRFLPPSHISGDIRVSSLPHRISLSQVITQPLRRPCLWKASCA